MCFTVTIDAIMTYGREKLGLATLKPEQETAVNNFALGKDKITGSWCFLNRCEESDDLGSQGSLLQMKQVIVFLVTLAMLPHL